MMALLLAFVGFLAAAARAEWKVEAVAGQATFMFKDADVSDFSGITWVGGDNFYAVANRAKAVFPLKLEIQPNGRINSAQLGKRIPVKSRFDDFEGVAYWRERDRVYVSTERPPGLIGFDLAGGATFQAELPRVFAQARANKSLESLAHGAGAFWTANEDALEPDGEMSSASEGALTRLQKFDERLRPVAQFAYRTERSLLRAQKSGTGVTDLVALPDGTLLVLERVIGLGLHAKIFHVDTKGAADTSALPSLKAEGVTPVSKRLVFDRNTGRRNFEGAALGPELGEGWRSLVLIEDSGGGNEHALIPLRLKMEAAR
jgi:hypothetical protein